MHEPSDGVPAREENDVLVEVEDHVVEDELAVGPDGVLYRARHERRPVALKVLEARCGADRALIERFTRGHPRRIRHPNLATVEALGETDQRLWYSVRFLRGDTLRRAIDDLIDGSGGRPSFGPLAASEDGAPPRDLCRRAARLIAEVAEGLARAHAEGLVHRRIDPDHLIFSPAGRLVLIHFDGRPVLRPSDPRADLAPGEMARWIYRAPELLSGGESGPPADVWSLGAILYEIVCFRPPYRAVTFAELEDAHRASRVLSPREARAEVPPALAHAITKALRTHPADRYANAALFAEDLRAFLRGELPAGSDVSFDPALDPESSEASARGAKNGHGAESRPQRNHDERGEVERLRAEVARLVANEERTRVRDGRLADEEKRLRLEAERIELEARRLREEEERLEHAAEALAAERSRLDWDAERVEIERNHLRGALEDQRRDEESLVELEKELSSERDRVAEDDARWRERFTEAEGERERLAQEGAALAERARALDEELAAIRADRDALALRIAELEPVMTRFATERDKLWSELESRDVEIGDLHAERRTLESDLATRRESESRASREVIELALARDRLSLEKTEAIRRERRRSRLTVALLLTLLLPIGWWAGSRLSEARTRLAAQERALASLDGRNLDEARRAANALVALDPGSNAGVALSHAVDRTAVLADTKSGLIRSLLALREDHPERALEEISRLAEKRPDDRTLESLHAEVRAWISRDVIHERISDQRASVRWLALQDLAGEIASGKRASSDVALARELLVDSDPEVRTAAHAVYRTGSSPVALAIELEALTTKERPLSASDFLALASSLFGSDDPDARTLVSSWSFEEIDRLDHASEPVKLPSGPTVAPSRDPGVPTFATAWLAQTAAHEPTTFFGVIPRILARSDLAQSTFDALLVAAQKEPGRRGEAVRWAERLFAEHWWHAPRSGVSALADLGAQGSLEAIVRSTRPVPVRELALDACAERFGEGALPLLESVADQNPNAALRDAAFERIARIAPPLESEARRKLLSSALDDPGRHAEARSWLDALAPGDHSRIAFDLLEKGDPELRKHAVDLLKATNSSAVTRRLVWRLFSPSRRLRSTSLEALRARLPEPIVRTTLTSIAAVAGTASHHILDWLADRGEPLKGAARRSGELAAESTREAAASIAELYELWSARWVLTLEDALRDMALRFAALSDRLRVWNSADPVE